MKLKFIIFIVTLILLISFSVYAANNDIVSITKKDSDNVTVLMYHHILPDKYMIGAWENNSSVLSLETFEEQMRFLHDNDYNILSLEEFNNYLYDNKPVPNNSILITFDDGYKSTFEYAYPVLKNYNFNATVFLITSAIKEYYEKDFNHEKLQFGSIKEIEDCNDIFTYGDHTYQLHKTDYETSKPIILTKTYEDINYDIKVSSAIMSKYIDEDTKAFAYPYGTYNSTSQKILEEYKYKLVFLTNNGQVSKNTNPYSIPRYGISSNEDFYNLFK